MLRNRRYRFLFAHVPKTAGAYTRRLLSQVPGTDAYPGLPAHAARADAAEASEAGWRVLVGVRNPFRWYESLYRFGQDHPAAAAQFFAAEEGFAGFVDRMARLEFDPERPRWREFLARRAGGPPLGAEWPAGEILYEASQARPELGWLSLRYLYAACPGWRSLLGMTSPEEAREAVRRDATEIVVLRQERLEEDLGGFLQEIGAAEVLAELRRGERVNVSSVYPVSWSPAMIDVVRARERLIFELFDYPGSP